ncbi:ABC transporter ATP-binding protein [Actinotalea solisilvae]|uniref:ABC transporter ATP-binding protein n=1 Tax=Actinotalea solisilvae TaxID=2072922 RepID=UPI0018F1D2FC|nr:ABC transporter ATP-binding protein [Actinotalea solisilvae]
MIRLEGVTVTYPGAAAPALRDVDLAVGEGELCLVVGPTGAGKSTLLRAVASLVPHFTGGLLEGRVVVDGRDTRTHLPRDLADVVGVVVQDPASGFVTDTVEEELAYGMEQLGVPPEVMRRRVEEVLDLLGLAALRDRPLADLSGGEQQRVAIGAVLTSHPRVLVLDEPTSALDPTAAEEVLAALTRLVHDLGMTVLLAEHRLERVVQYADRVVLVAADGTVVHGRPQDVLPGSVVAPPVVELARLAGWSPVPLSVRDARRLAAPLRERVVAAGAGAASAAPRASATAPLLVASRLSVRHGTTRAVREVDLAVRPGEVVAVMGRNGAGKSSLLWALQGAGPRSGGTVAMRDDEGRAGGEVAPTGLPGALGRVLRRGARTAPGTGGLPDPAALSPADARRLVGLVPQDPAQLLYLETVAAECAAADRESGAEPGTTAALLAGLAGTVPPLAHPRDLSEGQRLALVLAVQLAARPRVLLLDEPTRGLDYAAKARLATALREHAARAGAVLLSSHDVEFVAEAATRVVVLAAGEVVTDGPARDVLVASPTFAPQVAKVLHPVELLTVAAVAAALAVPA